MQSVCPTPNRLREFLDGSVDQSETNRISEHIAECPDCDLALLNIESEQSDVVKAFREGFRTESLLQEPELEQLRNTARLGQSDTPTLSDFVVQLDEGKWLRDYRLVKKIGEGGMGTVYQAFHVHLAKHVALKILPADKLTSSQSVKRFRQEMRAVGKVNHPNLVSASDAGTIDDQHFLVMELVLGADLARIMHERGPLQVADACEIVRQAAIGLQHAHDIGLVHRDVKPSNIMLAVDGKVKLLDLGLAGLNNTEFEPTANVVVSDRLTSVGQIIGTLDYMAPEQIIASPQVDGRADIYALGATLFQLLSGRTPCGNRTEGTPARIAAVLHQPPLDIATQRNDVPDELRGLLLKMLAKNPKDRPQAASIVAEDLKRFTMDADLEALAEWCKSSLDIPSVDVDVTDDVSFVVSRATQPQAELKSPRRFPAIALASLGLFLAMLAAVVVVSKDGENFFLKKTNDSSSDTLATAPAANDELAIAKNTLGFEGNITVDSLLKALDEGRLGYPLDENHPAKKQPHTWGGPINLRTSLRGEPGQETLYSPVLDLLRIGSKSNDLAERNNSLKLENQLSKMSNSNGDYRLETVIAATELAFHRGDFGKAKERLAFLQTLRSGTYEGYPNNDLSLWLVARYGLGFEETAAIGRELADLSLKAAEALPDPRFKEAILRERGKLLKDDQWELAQAATKGGDLKKARDILRTIPGVGSAKPRFLNATLPPFDSDAAVAYKLAELQQENQDLQAAADSYLEAFRLSKGTLIDYPFIEFFKGIGRLADLADVYTESVLQYSGGFNYIPDQIYGLLVADDSTRAKAYELLKRDWKIRGDDERFRYLRGEPASFRDHPEKLFYLRSLLLPQDISAEGSGWKFFNRFQYQGSLLVINPLLQDKQVVQQVADEIRAGTEKYPQWNAGVATLSLLEAELGNFDRSANLLEQLMATKETSIPVNSAKILGRSIEGKDRQLDRLVIRLYEYNLAKETYENGNYSSPALSLAKLYQQANQTAESRRAVLRLSGTLNQSCSKSFTESDGMSCTLCHVQEKSITDYNKMIEHLTQLGSPVDALLLQSRIDRSFRGILSGNKEWSQRALPELELKYYDDEKTKFLAIKTEAEQGITPQAVLQAFEEGQFLNEKKELDLRGTIRGENGLSTLSSPVIDILKLAAQSKAVGSADAIAALDARLISICQANPRDVKALVAATVIAFERIDLNAAEERLKKLQEFKEFSMDEIPSSNNLSIWFAARLALQNEQTKIVGAILAERVLNNLGEHELVATYRNAIQRERDAIRAK